MSHIYTFYLQPLHRARLQPRPLGMLKQASENGSEVGSFKMGTECGDNCCYGDLTVTLQKHTKDGGLETRNSIIPTKARPRSQITRGI